jgi:hypothetical protein
MYEEVINKNEKISVHISFFHSNAFLSVLYRVYPRDLKVCTQNFFVTGLFPMRTYQQKYLAPVALVALFSCHSPDHSSVQQQSPELRSAIVAYHVAPMPGPQTPPIPSDFQDLVSKVQTYLLQRNITPQFRPIIADLYTASILPLPPQVGRLTGGLYVCSSEKPLSPAALESIRDVLKHYGEGASAYRAFLDGKKLRLEEIR